MPSEDNRQAAGQRGRSEIGQGPHFSLGRDDGEGPPIWELLWPVFADGDLDAVLRACQLRRGSDRLRAIHSETQELLHNKEQSAQVVHVLGSLWDTYRTWTMAAEEVNRRNRNGHHEILQTCNGDNLKKWYERERVGGGDGRATLDALAEQFEISLLSSKQTEASAFAAALRSLNREFGRILRGTEKYDALPDADACFVYILTETKHNGLWVPVCDAIRAHDLCDLAMYAPLMRAIESLMQAIKEELATYFTAADLAYLETGNVHELYSFRHDWKRVVKLFVAIVRDGGRGE